MLDEKIDDNKYCVMLWVQQIKIDIMKRSKKIPQQKKN